MGVDGRRDHGFRVPRPDLDAATGAPDACTACHADRDPAWAAAEIARRFPASTHRGASFATAFAAARLRSGGAGGCAGRPRRAGRSRRDRAGERARSAGAGDRSRRSPTGRRRSSPIRTRWCAARRRGCSAARRRRRGWRGWRRLSADPLRSVRIAAAKATLGADPAGAPEAVLAALQAATGAVAVGARIRGGFPRDPHAGRRRGARDAQLAAAEAAFGEAVALDPQLVDGWAMIARIRAATGDQARGAAGARRRARGQSGAAGSRPRCARAGAVAR